MNSHLPKNGVILKWLLVPMAAFLIVTALPAGMSWAYENAYNGKIYRGVRIGVLDVSGLTSEQALEYLKTQAGVFNSEGIPFHFKGQQIRVRPTVIGAQDPDLTYDIFSFDFEQSVADAYAYGRQGDWIEQLRNQMASLVKPKVFTVGYDLDYEGLADILKSNFDKFEIPAKNAKLILPIIPAGQVQSAAAIEEVVKQASIETHQVGTSLDYDNAVRMAAESLANMQYVPIGLSQTHQAPEVFQAQAVEVLTNGDLSSYLSLAPLKLVHNDRSWTISVENINKWIDFGKVDGEYGFILRGPGLVDMLTEIAKKIDQPAKDAKFTMKGGRVVEFQPSKDGNKLFIDKTLDRINKAMFTRQTEIALAVEKYEPKTSVSSMNDLGIKEIIGVGKSNFARSPKNRRHNIAVGAARLNGVIIKPGENFSLLATLGSITGAAGYLPELVIKGNRTVPEYGGGLCQIGTTTFRAAVGSGLPITERQNHSYRVVYYEPAGFDATIYNPKPDFRFLNDTGNHILIQTRIEGDELTFEFWGTKDGRVEEHTYPRIYNVVGPPPTQTIETEDLPPGVKKCTESAHPGATAEFTYKITYPNGEVKEQLFKSYYRPWRAVCLVGKAPTTSVADPNAPPADPNAVPTPAPLNPGVPVVIPAPGAAI